MTLLSVQNIGKAYRSYRSEWQRFGRWLGIPAKPLEEHWVLRNVSFEIRSGESIGIVGKNGAGKSTLLKMITGTLQPTEGSIKVNGRIAAILELGMGFNPELTGRQNVVHAAGLMGFSTEEINGALPQIQAFSEIGEYFDLPLRAYSSGMQARVAFAVATAFRPDILIVDEALSVGDAYFQAKCYERIATFKKQGTTLILVTHAIEDIVKHCDRALFVQAGRLAKDGLPREVTNLYLDDLFGKKGAHIEQKNHPDLVAETFLDQDQEIFHTRPGYRKEEHRWGHGGAKILDYLVVSNGVKFPTTIDSGATVEFYFKVSFEESFKSIVPGILIKTLDGLFLYGTNSFIATVGKASLAATQGDISLFKFAIPMHLNEGYYLVSFGMSKGDPLHTLTPLERRYDSVIVHVVRPVQFWGLVDMQASFEIVHTEGV